MSVRPATGQQVRDRIYHPRKGHQPVPGSFVASGACADAVHQVIGRLSLNGQVVCYGKPIPVATVNGWALYFKEVPPGGQAQPYTLEVFGVIVNAQGALDVMPIDSPQPVIVHGRTYGPNIDWPYANESDLCPSNFVPYGHCNDAGTLTANLSGGYSAGDLSIQQDTTQGIWSATFAAFDEPQDSCTLTLYLDGAAQDSKSGLQFRTANC